MQLSINPEQATTIISDAQMLLHNIELRDSESAYATSVDLSYMKDRLGHLRSMDAFTFLNDEELEELQSLHTALELEWKTISTPKEKTGTGWGEPKDLPVTLPTAPAMPLELLPVPVRDWLVDEAERANLSVETIAVPFVVSLGGALGRKIAVHPKQKDSWFEVPNLWGVIVVPPSSKKSLALSTGMQFLTALEKRDILEYEEKMNATATQRQVLALDIERLENKIRKSGRNAPTVEELEKARQDLKDLELPSPRRIVNDTTTEKLGEMMSANSDGFTCVRDELSGLLSSYDKQGREGDRAFYLEAWNGKNSYTYDRVSRKSIHIEALTLSLAGGIQPGKLTRYVSGAVAGGDGADGLLQRFQLLVYPDTQPDFQFIDRLPDDAAFDAVLSIVERFDKLDPTALGAVPTKQGIPAIRFSEEAQPVFNQWYTKLQLELRNPELQFAGAYIAHLGK